MIFIKPLWLIGNVSQKKIKNPYETKSDNFSDNYEILAVIEEKLYENVKSFFTIYY